MKQSEFFNKLRKIVREEVKAELREFLQENAGASNEIVPGRKAAVDESNDISLLRNITKSDRKTEEKSRAYTKNPQLNSILSEVEKSFNPKTFDNDEDFVSNDSEKESGLSKELGEINPEAKNVVGELFNKDFKKILDESRKKSAMRHGGPIE